MSGNAVKSETEKVEANGPKKNDDVKPLMKTGDGGANIVPNKFHSGPRGPRGGPGGPRGPGGRGPGGMDNRNKGPRRDDNRPKNELMSIDTSGIEQAQRQGNRRGPMGGGGGGGGDRMQRSQDDRLNDRIATISGPTIELPPIDSKEKKFSGRCRLYIGNLTSDVTEEEIQQLFSPYGETSELFINSEKMFAFIRMDYRSNAEKAKRELDGFMRKGRALKVRFAPHSAAIKVKNLNQWVTNELLEWAFQVFGEIERAVVIGDERGKSTGEGIVEFARKPGATQALKRCTEGCYFLTSSLRPVIVEPFEQVDDLDGYSEKSLFKKSSDFFKEREVGPRFANQGSFENEYGTRWKQLHELYTKKKDALKREMKMEEEKLEAQMEYAKYEHETELLREQLRLREQDKERQKREWELKERQAEEQRRNDEELMRRQAEEMQLRMTRQEEELRRRQQENTLFMQAHQLSSLLDQQEQALGSGQGGFNNSNRGHLDLQSGDFNQGNMGPPEDCTRTRGIG